MITALRLWYAPVIAALLALAVYQHLRIRHWIGQGDILNRALHAEQAGHAVTRQSVATLQTALAEKNAETDARGAAYAEIKAADAKDVAAADRARDGDRGRIETLRAIAKAAERPGGCPAPPALRASLEGL